MRPLYRRAFAALFVICLAPVDAQDHSRVGQPTPDQTRGPSTRTGKERLAQKWTDEQRVDNCKVPVDKRGSKSRSEDCSHIPRN